MADELSRPRPPHSPLTPLVLSTARVSQPGDVRIVNVSSSGHKLFPKNGIDFADMNQEKGSIWSRYGPIEARECLERQGAQPPVRPQWIEEEEGEIWSFALHPGNMYTILNKNARVAAPLSGFLAKMLNALECIFLLRKGIHQHLLCGEW